jgi:hypothetical protein
MPKTSDRARADGLRIGNPGSFAAKMCLKKLSPLLQRRGVDRHLPESRRIVSTVELCVEIFDAL